ncbi:MAG: 2'-5' RNA ligase family protein [Pseudonocardiaceae bacterium]
MIRAAIADVWGPDNVPEDHDNFRPHVSLAYSNTAGPAAPISQRLMERPITSAEVTVPRATLIDVNRDNRAYQWTDVATAELGSDCVRHVPYRRPGAGDRAYRSRRLSMMIMIGSSVLPVTSRWVTPCGASTTRRNARVLLRFTSGNRQL